MFLFLINLVNYDEVTDSEAIKMMTIKKWTKKNFKKWTKRKIFGHIIFRNTKKSI